MLLNCIIGISALLLTAECFTLNEDLKGRDLNMNKAHFHTYIANT